MTARPVYSRTARRLHAGSSVLRNQVSRENRRKKTVVIRKVHLEKSGDGFAIPKIELETEADVPGVDEETFQRIAQAAKQGCPVSKVLSGADITLNAKLVRSKE
ncbi:MAG: hypothetical protein EA424_12215 [Planctomycetaceae bacterium]|nr:MAG: hypothetical protein EA424_12215 [Planctomycetaceae bacterium]